MNHYDYQTEFTCARLISFDMGDDTSVHNIKFTGGCNGNLKAISKLVDGWKAEEIEEKLAGNLCGQRPTSCADQLAKAVRAAANKQTANKEA